MIESQNSKRTYVVAENPVFAFDIPFFAPEDIHCYLYSEADKPERELSSDEFAVEEKTDYSTGANVTLLGTLVPGAKLTISREVGMTQDVALPEYGKLPSRSLEKQLDKLTMICQQLRAFLERCIVLPRGMADYDLERFYGDLLYVASHVTEWIDTMIGVRDQAAESAQDAAESAQDAAAAAEAVIATRISAHNSAADAHATLFSAKAPLASPTFTGTPTAPTAAAGAETTQIATTAFAATAAKNAVKSLGHSYVFDNSYLKLPGGLLVQWGRVNITAGSQLVTLPSPYKTAGAYRVMATDTGVDRYSYGTRPESTTTFSLYSNGNTSTICNWVAVGHWD